MITVNAGSVMATARRLLSEYRCFSRVFGVNARLYQIDVYALKDVAARYWRDVERLHGFHNMPRIDSRKIAGYLAYWLCKLHPIAVADRRAYLADAQKPKYVNEAFAAFVVFGRVNAALAAAGRSVGVAVDDKTLESLLYTLKYRPTSGDTLALFFEMAEKAALSKSAS